MAAAGAEARGGEGWRAAPLNIPRSPVKLPRPRKRGRDPWGRQSATRRNAAFHSADILAPKGAPRASPFPRSLTLLTARPARSPQSPPAPRFRGARSARPAPRSAVSRSAEVPRTPWLGPRCPLGRRPLPAWSPCGGIRAAAAAPGNPRGVLEGLWARVWFTPLWWFGRDVLCSGWLFNWGAGSTRWCKCDLSIRGKKKWGLKCEPSGNK